MLSLDTVRTFAYERHAYHVWHGGLPFTRHLETIQDVLAAVGCNKPEMVAAADLHDTVEEGVATLEEIRELAGDRVAFLVGLLTDRSEDRNENIAGWADTAKDFDAAVLRMADRASNWGCIFSLVTQDKPQQAELDYLQRYIDEFPILHRCFYQVTSCVLDEMWQELEQLYWASLRLLHEKHEKTS
jgi:(p)ppGpp synthase/HD superfamily hydrolase